MNSKFIVAAAAVALVALSSASAYAASSSQYAEPAEFARTGVTNSSVTRAQVQADYLAARKSGKLVAGQEFDVKPSNDSMNIMSREQVTSETMATGTADQIKLYSNAM